MALPSLILSRLVGTLKAFFRTEGGFRFKEIATPGTNPPSGYRKFYPKSDGSFYLLDSTGSESEITGGSTDGVCPIGAIIAHYAGSGLTGMPTIATVQGLGFALCDGTTPSSQGISDPVVTGSTPDLNGGTEFIRASDSAGTHQEHQLESHRHTVNVKRVQLSGYTTAAGLLSPGTTASGGPSGNSGTKTRPDYCTVIWFMRAK